MDATQRHGAPKTDLMPAFADLLLAVADDKLLLGHRNSDWTGLGPVLEEDIAFSSIAQDEIAHARELYRFAGKVLDRGEDALAFGRPPEAFRSASIVEIPDDFDWAVALARKFYCDHFDLLRLRRLARSNAPDLAALATRLVAEERIHVEHVDGWLGRLGGGTDDSLARMQAALDGLAPIAPMLLEPVADEPRLVAAGLYPADEEDMFEAFSDTLTRVADAAGLRVGLEPIPPGVTGGRHGRHTEHLGPLLEEMCEVYRIEPEADW